MTLRVEIDRDLCMGSGNCVHWAPETFALDDDEIATVVDPNAAPEDKIMVAAQRCPTRAITVSNTERPAANGTSETSR